MTRPPSLNGVVVRRGIIPTGHVRGVVRYVLATPAGIDPRSIDHAIFVLPGRGDLAEAALSDIGVAGFAADLWRAGSTPFAVFSMTPQLLRFVTAHF